MIVPMKRLTLVCLTTDRPSALYQLRDLGVVHVTDRRPPAGEELDELRARLAGEQRALAALPAGAGSKGADGAEASGRTALEPGAVVEEVLGLLDRRDELSRARGGADGASWPATRRSASSTSRKCWRSSAPACGRRSPWLRRTSAPRRPTA